MNRWALSGVLVFGLLLTGCSEVDSAVGQATDAKDKASACAEALGLANLNPLSMDPDKVKNEATQKAERLRELGNQVADGNVKDTLFTMADSYVALEKKHVENLADVTDWVRTNSEHVGQLRKVCL